jgi:hypothetical protein
MRTTLVLSIFLILCCSCVFAQEYIMDGPRLGGGYTPLTGATQVTALAGGNWDDGYFDLSWPPGGFRFFGQSAGTIRISTNGYITFGPGIGTDPSNDPIPRTNSPNTIIAVYWDDLDLSSQGSIWYLQDWFIFGSWVYIEWRDVKRKGTTSSYDFTVSLWCSNTFEPGKIILSYGDVTTGPASTNHGLSATIGVENALGNYGEEYSYNTAAIYNDQYIVFTPYTPVVASTDFFGTGYPDNIIFRPSEGNHYIRRYDGMTEVWNWGIRGDVPVYGDYDGDGDADLCVYRPTDSVWYGLDPNFAIQWGKTGDIPVPADYDNDGKTDVAVFRFGYWYIKYSSGGSGVIRWGDVDDIPLPADYDNDGIVDLAVFRRYYSTWYIRKSSNPSTHFTLNWGQNGDIPMATNRFSSSYATASVFRPGTGMWYHYNQLTAASLATHWGTNGDLPVPYDQTASGISQEVVFRPQNGSWYNQVLGTIFWGGLGDKPRARRSQSIILPKSKADRLRPAVRRHKH